jgi:hypothetical protein
MSKEIINTETGEIIENDSRLSWLISLEKQIAMSYVEVALALKMIKEEQLYLLRGFETMKDYAQACLGMNIRSVERRLQLANAFSEKVLNKVMGNKVPVNKLLEITKDARLIDDLEEDRAEIQGDRVVYSDGTEDSLDDVIRSIKIRNNDEKKELTERLAGKDELLRKAAQRENENQEEVNKLRQTLSRVVSEKGLDPDRAIYITQKKQAVELIENSLDSAIRAISGLDSIPYELLDSELSAQLSAAISAIDAGIYRTREHYGAAIWIPKNEAPRDLIPE